MTPKDRPRAFLTIDYEDYRRQELRDHLNPQEPPHPEEVMRQTDLLLDTLDDLGIAATFFSVGRLVDDLPSSVWNRIATHHRVGCHSHEHLRVVELGPDAFYEDTRTAKARLEDAVGAPVISYRAPYFSVDGCSPWYGEKLAEAGFRLDSSQRLSALELRSARDRDDGERASDLGPDVLPLPGSAGRVGLLPLQSIGLGPKRLTIIGGTYFRLLPTSACQRLLSLSRARGFVPIVYLHPYDLDPSAEPLAYPSKGYGLKRAGDRVRRVGRAEAAGKLKALSKHFDFQPVESVLAAGSA